MINPTDKMLPWLEKALDLSSRRHTLLSSNIANVDTPDYKPKDVEFVDHLRSELGRPQGTSATMGPTAQTRPGVDAGLDENHVDLDEEVVRITSNRMFHQLTIEIINRKLSALRYAIDEGGR